MKKAVKCSVIIFCTVLLIVSAVFAPARAEKNQSENLFQVPVEPAPNFTLSDLNGRTVALSDYRGNFVLLNFTTTWCPYCKKILPFIKELHDKYTEKGLVIFAVDIQESSRKVRSHAEKNDIPYAVLLDEKADVAVSYGVKGVPMLVLIDKKGNIICRQCRSVDLLLEAELGK